MPLIPSDKSDSLTTGVYRILNVKNGKRYVGSTTVGFRSRKNDHWRKLKSGVHANRHLQNAWNVYGEEAFVFQIVERCIAEKCLEREQFWLDLEDAANQAKGYNICRLAENRLGVKATPMTRLKGKLAKQNVGIVTRAKLSRLASNRTPAHKAKIVAAKHANGTQGHTQETKDHLREVNSHPTVETLAKISKANKGVPKSPEHKAKIAKAIAEYHRRRREV